MVNERQRPHGKIFVVAITAAVFTVKTRESQKGVKRGGEIVNGQNVQMAERERERDALIEAFGVMQGTKGSTETPLSVVGTLFQNFVKNVTGFHKN